jgi:transmembrane sensor
MTSNQTHSEPADAVYAEASEWLVEIREGDLDSAGHSRFSAWLRRSPDHIRAYLELAALWSDIPRLTANMEVDVEAVVAHARAQSKVAPINSKVGRTSAASSDGRRRSRMALIALAASVIVVAIASGLWHSISGNIFATSVGEERLINLPDGTAVELSPRTRIHVHLTRSARHIDLLTGQALFRVAKDPARPFTVASQNTEIRAVGTQFDVQQRPSGTTVMVLEGSVAITSDSPETARERVLVAAGEQLIVPVVVAEVPRPRPIDPKVVTTWTDHVLNFQDATLADVIEEFNRYNEKQILLEGPELSALRVSGVFSATKPVSLLKFLSTEMQLDVSETDREVRIRPRTQK